MCRGAEPSSMRKSNLHPPRQGLNANPVLYGVAAGLAELFPLRDSPKSRPIEGDDEGEGRNASSRVSGDDRRASD